MASRNTFLSDAVQHRAMMLVDAARDDRIEQLRDSIRDLRADQAAELMRVGAVHRDAINAIESERDAALVALTSADAERRHAIDQLGVLDAQLRGESAKGDALAAQIATQRQQIAELIDAARSAEEDATLAEARAARADTDLRDATTLVCELQEQIRALRKRPPVTHRHIQAPDGESTTFMRSTGCTQTEGDMQQALTSQNALVEALRVQLREATESGRAVEATLAATVATADERVAKAEQRCDEARRLLAASENRFAQATSSSALTVQSLEADLHRERSSAATLRADLEAVSRRCERSQAESASLTASLRERDDREASLERQLATARDALSRANEDVASAFAQRSQAIRAADDAALGLRRAEATARAAVEDLDRERTHAGRSTESVQALRQELREAQDALIKADMEHSTAIRALQTTADAHHARADDAEQRVISIDSQWKRAFEALEAELHHERTEASARFTAAEAKERELVAKVSSLEQSLQLAQRASTDTSNHAAAKNRAATNELVELQLEVARAAAAAERERAAASAALKRAAESEDRNAQLQRSLQAAEERADRFQQAISDLNTQLAVAKQEASTNALLLEQAKASTRPSTADTDAVVAQLRAELRRVEMESAERTATAVDEVKRVARDERDDMMRRCQRLERDLANAQEARVEATNTAATSQTAATILELQRTVFDLQRRLVRSSQNDAAAATAAASPPLTEGPFRLSASASRSSPLSYEAGSPGVLAMPAASNRGLGQRPASSLNFAGPSKPAYPHAAQPSLMPPDRRAAVKQLVDELRIA